MGSREKVRTERIEVAETRRVRIVAWRKLRRASEQTRNRTAKAKFDLRRRRSDARVQELTIASESKSESLSLIDFDTSPPSSPILCPPSSSHRTALSEQGLSSRASPGSIRIASTVLHPSTHCTTTRISSLSFLADFSLRTRLRSFDLAAVLSCHEPRSLNQPMTFNLI